MTILIFDKGNARIINGRNVTDVYITQSQAVFYLVNGRDVVVNFEALKDGKQLKVLAFEIAIHLTSDTTVNFDWLVERAKRTNEESD